MRLRNLVTNMTRRGAARNAAMKKAVAQKVAINPVQISSEL